MFLSKLFKRKKEDFPIWKCLRCKHFCWWEGDYCCLDNYKILIESSSGKITREQYDAVTRKYKHCWFFKKKEYRWNKDGLYCPLDKLIKK